MFLIFSFKFLKLKTK